jgi:ankyrin repeat protein
MGIKASVENSERRTPLHYCVAAHSFTTDRAKIVHLLLANGASLEDKCSNGKTPLHQAFGGLGCVAMVEFLLSLGAKTSAATNNGDTPLHLAANINKMDIACKLLDLGADLNTRNNAGRTPLDIAANPKVANALLTHKLAIVSRENAQFRQEVRDLKNLFLAFGFANNMDRVVDSTTTTTTTTTTTATTSDEEEVEEEVCV